MTSVNRPVGSTFINPLRVIDIKDSDHLQAAKFSRNIATGSGTAIKSIPKEVPLKSAHYRAYIIAIVQDKIDLTGRLKLCWIVRTGEDFPIQLNYLIQGTNLDFTGDVAVKSWSAFKQGDADVPAGSHRYIFLHRLSVNEVTVTACLPQSGFHGMLDGKSKEDFEKRSTSLQLALQQQQPVQQQQNPVQQQQQVPQQQVPQQQQPGFLQQLGFQQPIQQQLNPAQQQLNPAQQQLNPAQQQLNPVQQQLSPVQQQLNFRQTDQQPNPLPGYPLPVDSLTTTAIDVPDNGRKRKVDQGGPPEQDPSDPSKRHQKAKPPNHDGASKPSNNPQSSGADMEMS